MTPRILVVDDEPDIRALLMLILSEVGYDVYEAAGGTEALAILTDRGADLVVLDVMMPELDGWEVCRRIKADPALAHIPVIINTVRSLTRDQAAYDSARPDAFLNKPFDPVDLLHIVAAHLPAEVKPA